MLDTLAPGGAARVRPARHVRGAVRRDRRRSSAGPPPPPASSPAAARRRVQGADASRRRPPRQREVVDAFLAASRGGDFDALLALLDPDVVLRADAATVLSGAAPEVHGADAVAATFTGRARVAQTALVDGFVGAVWSAGGKPRVVFDFVVEDGRVVEIELLGDPSTLERLDLTVL